ncbi:thiamine-phosphate kinase [Oceanicoccus sagamiensis]|uniref:Thiamine-monophosphate kinase n=1 Tax=Oceanicoccus sagamiensis TaxID=716816 RepID=A0A1X9NDD7_9GAMM|nr:thiamine-phosphate kinase [Oceanicoccus sagamiensis]ARN74412.1 thiamine-phosphate kinase [Oceanicoccus sagamiensis]
MSDSGQLSEFDIIARYFADIDGGTTVGTTVDTTAGQSAVTLGVGDDCALLSLPPGQQLALSIDTLVSGRHFPENANPYQLAERALAVSISDLAAMGATPLAFTLALTLPAVDTQWLDGFSRGLRAAAQAYKLPLMGGDTTQGPLSLTVQVHGSVSAQTALKRSAAKPGDAIFVSGTIGDAAVALAMIQGRLTVDQAQQNFLNQRFYQPSARLDIGQGLLGLANAAIDISDGLLADLAHIAKASQLAAVVNVDQLPLSSVIKAVVEKPQALAYALSGGDDYELCFTAPPENRALIKTLGQQLGVPITEVGTMLAGSGVSCIDASGGDVSVDASGYQHFNHSE